MDSVSRTALAVVGSSAIEIARAIASGEISASEVVEAHVQRIEAVNPSLNSELLWSYSSTRAFWAILPTLQEKNSLWQTLLQARWFLHYHFSAST